MHARRRSLTNTLQARGRTDMQGAFKVVDAYRSGGMRVNPLKCFYKLCNASEREIARIAKHRCQSCESHGPHHDSGNPDRESRSGLGCSQPGACSSQAFHSVVRPFAKEVQKTVHGLACKAEDVQLTPTATMCFAADTVVVITGSNRGLGFHFVKQLLETTPSTVVATARSPNKADQLHALKQHHGKRLLLVTMETSDENGVQVTTICLCYVYFAATHSRK